jgi:hypothetical protein
MEITIIKKADSNQIFLVKDNGSYFLVGKNNYNPKNKNKVKNIGPHGALRLIPATSTNQSHTLFPPKKSVFYVPCIDSMVAYEISGKKIKEIKKKSGRALKYQYPTSNYHNNQQHYWVIPCLGKSSSVRFILNPTFEKNHPKSQDHIKTIDYDIMKNQTPIINGLRHELRKTKQQEKTQKVSVLKSRKYSDFPSLANKVTHIRAHNTSDYELDIKKIITELKQRNRDTPTPEIKARKAKKLSDRKATTPRQEDKKPKKTKKRKATHEVETTKTIKIQKTKKAKKSGSRKKSANKKLQKPDNVTSDITYLNKPHEIMGDTPGSYNDFNWDLFSFFGENKNYKTETNDDGICDANEMLKLFNFPSSLDTKKIPGELERLVDQKSQEKETMDESNHPDDQQTLEDFDTLPTLDTKKIPGELERLVDQKSQEKETMDESNHPVDQQTLEGFDTPPTLDTQKIMDELEHSDEGTKIHHSHPNQLR